MAISTLGKVIKRGWDWLGLSPTAPDRVGGLVEAPALAQCLTLNKADFIRAGARGAVYLAYRKAIQEAVAAQLGAWGDLARADESARRRAARPVERDLEKVRVEMAADFPLLLSLVESRAGGQRRLAMHGAGNDGWTAAGPLAPAPPTARHGAARRPGARGGSPRPGARRPRDQEGRGRPRGRAGARRPRTESRRAGRARHAHAEPLRPEPPVRGAPRGSRAGRLVDATVWINEAHPAYRRAAASRSEGYHIAVAVALALGAVAVEPPRTHAFVTAFLGTWGAAMGRRRRRS
jgi:hypothetical protein